MPIITVPKTPYKPFAVEMCPERRETFPSVGFLWKSTQLSGRLALPSLSVTPASFRSTYHTIPPSWECQTTCSRWGSWRPVGAENETWKPQTNDYVTGVGPTCCQCWGPRQYPTAQVDSHRCRRSHPGAARSPGCSGTGRSHRS